MSGAKPGDPARLGAELGHPMEPGMRYARLVGILHGDVARWAVVRVYRDDDRTGIPTGEYRTTFLAVPFEPWAAAS